MKSPFASAAFAACSLALAACGPAAAPVPPEAPAVATSAPEPATSAPEPATGPGEAGQCLEPVADASMTNELLGQLLNDLASTFEGADGRWKLSAHGVQMLVLTDAGHDRMRIVAAVVEAKQLDASQVGAILAANFHTALDARYAIHDGVLFAAFIHPLSPLDEKQVRSALRQVASLVQNFGTSYSSGELMFGPGRPPSAPNGGPSQPGGALGPRE